MNMSVPVFVRDERGDEFIHLRVPVALGLAHADEVLESPAHAHPFRRVIQGDPVVGVELVNQLGEPPDAARAVMHGAARVLERRREVGREVREADRQCREGRLAADRDGVELGQCGVCTIAEERRKLGKELRRR